MDSAPRTHGPIGSRGAGPGQEHGLGERELPRIGAEQRLGQLQPEGGEPRLTVRLARCAVSALGRQLKIGLAPALLRLGLQVKPRLRQRALDLHACLANPDFLQPLRAQAQSRAGELGLQPGLAPATAPVGRELCLPACMGACGQHSGHAGESAEPRQRRRRVRHLPLHQA